MMYGVSLHGLAIRARNRRKRGMRKQSSAMGQANGFFAEMAKKGPRMAAFTMALMLLGCTPPPPPPARFLQQADRFHDGALSQAVTHDEEINAYLQDIGDRLARAAHDLHPERVNESFIGGVRCHLVDCDTINAFSAGGSHVYVTTALFQQCQSENEVAAAMAHAYAHLVNLDLESTKMLPDNTSPLSLVAWQYVTNRFSLAQERRADATGLEIYARAGWDPNRFGDLFDRMEGLTGGSVARDRDPLPIRAGAAMAKAAELHRPERVLPVADPRTFITLRDRADRYHEPPGPPTPVIFVRAMPNCILSADTPEQVRAQELLRPVAPAPIKALEPN